MSTGDGAHEEDDRHDHQPGRDHSRGQADLALGVENPPARGDEHEHERPEHLREQPAPLQARIVELGLGAELEREQMLGARSD